MERTVEKQGTIYFDTLEDAPEIQSFHVGWRRVLFGFHIFHWIFVITLPAVGGIWSSPEDGYPWAIHITFAIYCAALILFEMLLLHHTPRFWEWAKSRRHLTKSISVPKGCWSLLILIDLATATFSRGDLYTDVTFVWLAYQYDVFFVPSLVCMIIGIGLQMSMSCFIAIFIGRGEELELLDTLLHGDFRGMDFTLSMRFLQSLAHYTESKTLASAAVVDAIVCFLRFVFEDLVQAVMQILFVLHPRTDDIPKSSKNLVFVSVGFAVVLSAIRTFHVMLNQSNRRVIASLFRLFCSCGLSNCIGCELCDNLCSCIFCVDAENLIR